MNRWWLPENISPLATQIDHIFYVILAVTGIVFVAVQVALVMMLVRYRKRENTPAFYTHGHPRLEMVWTIIPTILLLFLAFYSKGVWSTLRQNFPDPKESLVVEMTAQQFAWNFRYPGPDGLLNTPDDVLTVNQFHVIVDKPVLVKLRSLDVIHSFFLPNVRVKHDVVPGIEGQLWFVATKSGDYEIACAELCGLGHYRMKGFMTVDTPETFKIWMDEQIQLAKEAQQTQS